METTAGFRSAMVSRLPKFGGRSSTGGTSALPNGSTQTATPQDGKTSHPNGVIRASSFSFKWKKDDTVKTTSPTTAAASEENPKTQMAASTKEVKKASPGTPKIRRSGPLVLAASSPKTIPKHAAKASSKSDTKISQSQPNGSSKICHGGSTPTESHLGRPKLLSSSRSSSQDSLSQSSDCLKNLTLDSMVRSNSFTHFKQIPSPSSQPMTRSFSFNRAVELAKPLANTQLRPPRTSLLKPPQLSNGRVGVGMGVLNENLSGSAGLSTSLGGLQYSKNLPIVSSLPTLSSPSAPNTPSSLKKPLLPNCVLSKSLNSNVASVGYKLIRASTVRQQPLLPGRAKEKIQPLAPERKALVALASDAEIAEKAEKSDFHSDSEGSSQERKDVCRQNQSGKYAETLEDMSLSSASSLDRGDTSEEFLDDFDSTGDALSDVDAAENSDGTQSRLQRLLDETTDWLHPGVAEPKDISPMDVSCSALVLSSESSHAPAGSSFELSPSSSGGTYMWDEEGLEPIEGSVSHPENSYEDTDLNSIDILNNLEPLGAAELEEDDLMLDVDLPVDLPVDNLQEMSHVERSERGRLGPRRRHHRWSASDHFHNSNRIHGFPHYDGFKAPRFSSQPCYSNGKQHVHIQAFDELTLEHMSQDCSALKSHLLRLHDLLQLEDAECPAELTDVETEDKNTALQLQELIKEVQGLKEELKIRDRTIAQLTLQCQQLQQQPQQMPAQGHQVRCQCHHQRAPHSPRTIDSQMDKRKQQLYDKATQTHFRHPANTGVLPTPMLSPWQAQNQGLARPSMQQRRHTSNTTAFQPQPQRASAPGKSNKSSLHRGPQ